MIGGAVMAWGVRGVLLDAAGTEPGVLTRWVIGADLLHDFLLAPLVIAAGWLVVRIVPARVRVPIQAGLVASGVVILVGWPAWRGYGRAVVPDNPTVQPLDYTTAILTVLGIVWVVVAIWIAARLVRARVAAAPDDRGVNPAAADARPPAVTVPRP